MISHALPWWYIPSRSLFTGVISSLVEEPDKVISHDGSAPNMCRPIHNLLSPSLQLKASAQAATSVLALMGKCIKNVKMTHWNYIWLKSSSRWKELFLRGAAPNLNRNIARNIIRNIARNIIRNIARNTIRNIARSQRVLPCVLSDNREKYYLRGFHILYVLRTRSFCRECKFS